jgi:hypothetical protein
MDKLAGLIGLSGSVLGKAPGLAGVLACVAMVGCAGSPGLGPEVLLVESARYEAAFDAAVAAARDQGLPAVLRDRRSGVIETDARIAGSLIEPWRTDNESLAQARENTLAFQRRRARFEFSPAGFQPPESDAASGSARAEHDLTRIEGQLELRVWVFVERAHNPGVRRSTWTRKATTETALVVPEGERGIPAGMQWTPITRDPAYERRLLAAVEEALAAPP